MLDGIATLLRRYDDRDGLWISQEDYNRLARHEYAGPGTPVTPKDDGTVWIMAMDDDGATCLWTGCRIGPSDA